MGLFRAGRFLIRQFIKRNTDYLKRTSSGRDLVYCCDYTHHQWHAGTSGFGGSEEAVINLSRELTKLGWDVTVYNNCGHKPSVHDGVTYRPWWEFNPRDKQDVVILWRWPKPADWGINADKLIVDMQDTIPDDMFTRHNRIDRIDRVFFKSDFHRASFPSLPDHKVAVVPNGIDLSLLTTGEEKDPNLLINTSSADRSMSVLPKLFRKVKERVPQARLQWAYGWGLFESLNAKQPEKIEWMHRALRDMQDAGIEALGNLSPAEVGKLYQRGAIFAYPTDFLENDCISVRKAQASGCVPVTVDIGALTTTVQFGIKIPYTPAPTSSRPRRFDFGIEDEATQQRWIDETVDLLTNSQKRMDLARKGEEWGRRFGCARIAAQWHDILRA